MKNLRKILSLALAILLALPLPVQVLAETYDLSEGSVVITADDSGQYSNRTTGADDPRQNDTGKGYRDPVPPSSPKRIQPARPIIPLPSLPPAAPLWM